MAAPLLSLFLALMPPVWAEGPLHQGLPDTLEAGFIESSGFVDFERLPGGARAPLGFAFIFNGRSVPPTDFPALAEVFSEQFLARLPRGTRIVSSRDSQGRAIWDYPIGTQALHVVRLADAAKTLFEVRIIEKRADGQWAYGVYMPRTSSPGLLALQKTDNPNPLIFSVERPDGRRIDVSMRAVTINSCRRCHFVNSASRHQYPDEARAGPSHFVPDNAAAMKDWIEKYAARHGESPLEIALFRVFK